MGDMFADITSAMQGLAACLRATEACRAAMLRFQTACAIGNWNAAEIARAETLAAMEVCLDEFMSAQRAALGADPNGKER